MKITTAENLRSKVSNKPDFYTVRSPRDTITLIDSDENILDLFKKTALRYTIDEAEDLVLFFKTCWIDFSDDPYYRQGQPLYPIYQQPHLLDPRKIQTKKYTSTIIAYRYKLVGEWIYGITNCWTEIVEGKHERAIEAPMDGWEKWLADRKAMLTDKWIAEHGGNL